MTQSIEDWRRAAADEAADAPVSGRGNYFTDGEYPSLIIAELKFHKGADNEVSFICETMVEQSRSVSEIDEHGNPVTANQVGTRASAVYPKRFKTTKGNIKALAMAIAGVTEHDIARDQAAENARAQAAGEQPRKLFSDWIIKATNTNPDLGKVNPYRGVRIAGSSYRQKRRTQPEGTPRKEWPTYMKFRHVPGQTTEMVLDGRKKLDEGIPDAPAAPAPTQRPTTGQGVPPATAPGYVPDASAGSVASSPSPAAPPPVDYPAPTPPPAPAPAAPPSSGLGGSMLDGILP